LSETFVFGASGYIGMHLAEEVDSDSFIFVTRSQRLGATNKRWINADLLKPESLADILTANSCVINLAYSAASTPEENVEMAKNLMQACIKAKVSKLVHCSTAVVAGVNKSPVIDEDAECLPSTVYERTKLEIERIFMLAADADLKVCILRPTAVLGTGGQNIRKMLSEIQCENSLINFVRSSIQGKRKLNLIPVRDVVRALLHLSSRSSISSGIYICSADDDPDNRYDHVEQIIRAALKQEKRMGRFPLPGWILKLALKISRDGSGQIANRYYSAGKLISTGFQRTATLSVAVRDFVLYEIGMNPGVSGHSPTNRACSVSQFKDQPK
jgi:nucleoside-diphosphate-sugar epimerase